MSINITLHRCENAVFSASVGSVLSGYGGVSAEWIVIEIGDYDFTVFMPVERARLLADAINSAEAAWREQASVPVPAEVLP